MHTDLDLSDEALACFDLEGDFVPKPSVTCPKCWEISVECECDTFTITLWDGWIKTDSFYYSSLGEAREALVYLNAVVPPHIHLTTDFEDGQR